jgi:hypothetical protein
MWVLISETSLARACKPTCELHTLMQRLFSMLSWMRMEAKAALARYLGSAHTDHSGMLTKDSVPLCLSLTPYSESAAVCTPARRSSSPLLPVDNLKTNKHRLKQSQQCTTCSAQKSPADQEVCTGYNCDSTLTDTHLAMDGCHTETKDGCRHSCVLSQQQSCLAQVVGMYPVKHSHAPGAS